MNWTRILQEIILLVAAVIVLFPFIWFFITIAKSDLELRAFPPLLPGQFAPDFSALMNVLKPPALFQDKILDSLIIVGTTTVIALVVGTLGAYAITRLEFRGRENLAFSVLTYRMMPPIAVLIPYYILFSFTNLLDTYLGMILIYLTMTIPLCLWLMRSYLDDIPRDLDAAAQVDGCSPLGAFVRIIVPLALPALVVTALFCFLSAYNEFLLAFVLTRHIATVPVGLASFVTFEGPDWPSVFAASLFSLIPMFIIFLYLQKHIVEGLTLGAVKA